MNTVFKKTPKIFSLEIEKIANETGLSHFDAVLYYCDKNELEVETVSKLITKGLKCTCLGSMYQRIQNN